MKRNLAFLLVLLSGMVAAQKPYLEKSNLDLSLIRRLPVLEGQRYKPLDSMAREWVELITGKEEFQGVDPVLMFLHFRFEFEKVRDVPLIKIHRARAVAPLGIKVTSSEDDHVSFDTLVSNPKLESSFGDIIEKKSEARNDDDNDILDLRTRLRMLGAFGGMEDQVPGDPALGGYLPCIPSRTAPVEGTPYQWLSPSEAVAGGWEASKVEPIRTALGQLRTTYLANDGDGFRKASEALLASVDALGYPKDVGDLSFPGMARIDREVRLNKFAPFKKAWWIYFLGFLFALAGTVAMRVKWLGRPLLGIGAATTVGALGFQVWGMIERTVLSGRAMIGTFYESLVYVSAAVVLFGIIFDLIFRQGWFMVGGSLLGSLGLFVATHNPDFMRPAISNLRPVLINNDWIHIHVPTIMTAYSVLALAATLGAIWLIGFCFVGGHSPGLKRLAKTAFWMIPVGEVFLFAGIILGAIWADASWGRPWGWDPKEVGALILFLVYMVVIHGRWAGWLRDFGTAMGCLVGVLALGWSYYGTNFFWVGLHSYAASGGGKAIPIWMYWLTGASLVVGIGATIRWMSEPRLPPARKPDGSGTAAAGGAVPGKGQGAPGVTAP